jgi:GNAT superfamily N-acetyltransferase
VAIRIEIPEGGDALTEFVLFHDRVYASCPARWSAFVPLELPILAGQSPFVEGRRVRPFVARAGGEIVARVAAVVDSRYNRHWRERLGHIVMFEALPDTGEAVRLLLGAACEWLEHEGTDAARAGFGMLEFPFVIDAYDLLPPPFVRQNPAYYHALLKDAGFETEKGLVDYKIRVRPELVARWESAVEAARRAGYTLVPLKEVPEKRRVPEFTELWHDAFKTHWGFTPFSEGEVALLVESLGPVGMLDLSLIAYQGARPVGVLWVLPEISFTAAMAPGHAVSDAEKLNFLGIGVREEARGRGVNTAMAGHAYLELVRRGATYLSYTIVLDDNWPSRRTAGKLGAEVCGSYLVYRRSFRP